MTEKFTILHTADWHVCDDFMKDARACLAFLVGKAGEISPDLIVITGDIYESRQIRQESKAARFAFSTVRNLAKIAPVVALVGTPSHDGNAPELLREIREKYPVWVEGNPNNLILHRSEKRGQVYFTQGEKRNLIDDCKPVAFISCAPAFTKQHFRSDSDIVTSDQEIAKELGSIFAQFGVSYNEILRSVRFQAPGDSIPHILLGHWSIGGAFIHPSQAMTGLDIEIARDHVELANATVTCLGHIHAQQKIGANIFYCGSTFATDFGEMEAKGFYVHTLDTVDMGDHWEIEGSDFIHTPSPQLVKLTSDLLNVQNDKTATIALMQVLKSVTPNPAAIIRLEVKIYQDMAETIDEAYIKEMVTEKLNPRKFDLNISRLPRPNVRSARILEADRLRDKLITRSEIINEPLDNETLDKADVLEDNDQETVFAMVHKEVQL